jgi:hypothetical protein
MIVLTDSVRSQFNQLFVDIKGIDPQVRGVNQFDQARFGQTSPISDTLLPEVEKVPGVKAAAVTLRGSKALVIGTDGKPVEPTGGPALSVTLTPDLAELVDHRVRWAPSSNSDVGPDIDTAKKADSTSATRSRSSRPSGRRTTRCPASSASARATLERRHAGRLHAA